MWKHRLLTLLLIVAMVIPFAPTTARNTVAAPLSTPDAIVNFTVLHTNDFHGNLEAAGSNPGIARTAAVINAVRADVGGANVRLFDAGDIMQGSLLSNIQQGVPTIDLFNFVGYDAATLGNHEFDWGQAVLEQRVGEADFPFLAANLTLKVGDSCAGWDHPTYIEPWQLIPVGAPGAEAQIGLIGITSIETPYITVAAATEGLCFKDPVEAVAEYYDDVVAAGADVIIILSHLGNTDGGYGYGFPVYGDQTLARRLVQAGKPAHLIIGGHSHTDLAAAQNISGTLVVQAHYAGRKVGRADFTVNQTTGDVSVSWQRLTVSPTGPVDAPTQARVDTWVNDPAYQALINQVIGFSNVDLIRNYNGDSLMGKFIQDAIYGDLNNDLEPLNDVDMVFNNPGGIRADLISPTKPFTLTYGMLFSVLPFGNQTVVGDMTGAAILELLNQSASLFKGAIQVGGIRYKFYSYTDTHPGPQPWAWGAYDVEVYDRTASAWEPLELDRTYRVATNEFLAPAGQDGFTAFKYMTNLSYWGDMLNGVNRWVAANYGTTATAYNEGLDGRITRDGNNASGSVIPVTILHNNDSHGYFSNYYKLASAIKEQRLHNPDRTLLLNAGDQIQGDSMMYYFKTAGLGYSADGQTLPITLTTHPMMALMNVLDYDAMTVGNHEYNFGNTVFTATLSQAEFAVLQANVYDDGRYGLDEVPVEPHATFTLPVSGNPDIKVAVLGIGNHRVPNYELPSNIAGLTFTNPITETQMRAPALKAANDVVIALTHIGFTENPASIEVDTNVDTNLAKQTTAVDAIIGGHSHTYPAVGFGATKYLPTILPNADGDPVILNQAGRRNDHLGVVVLGLLPDGGGGYQVVSRSGRYIATSAYPPDADAKAVGDPYTALLNVYNNTVIGQTTTPIDTLLAYTQETNGANLQADASVWELAQNSIDVDFHLSGAMTNAKVAASATPADPVTLKVSDMFSLMPYENSLVVMEINGPQLKAILERGYRNYYYYKYVPAAGGYSYYTTCMLDVNFGNQITYRDTYPLLPNGNNVVSLEVDGQMVDFTDAGTFYTVSTVNYLAAGSCNFNNAGESLWPLDNILYDTQYYVRDAVINYITDQSLISPAIEGRLVFDPFMQTPGLLVAPLADAKMGAANTAVEYTLHITNTGNMADTFLFSYTGDWPAAMPASVNVAAGATAAVTVQVMIPASAASGDVGATTVTVKSQAAPTTTQAQAVLTTTVAFELTLLHTNDFHARVDQYNRNGARCKPADEAAGLCIAGVSRLATKIAEIRAEKDNVLLLDAGDQFQGTLFFTLFGADVLTDTMNALGYDAMAIGNHEFDSGPAELARFIGGANFPVISSNIDATAEPLLAGMILPYAIIERGGEQIGIIGLTTPDTENISSPGPNIVFNPVITAAQDTVDVLTGLGVNKIIALTHLGYSYDLELAAAVSGIDVIIGGHSHSFLYDPPDPISFTPPTFPQFGPLVPAGAYPTVVASPAAEPVLVVTAYQWGTFLGALDVGFVGGTVAYYDGNPIYMGADVAKDPALEALLDEYRPAIADLIATPVGTTTVDLLINVGGQQICRLGECLMGNLVADAMLWKANQAEPGANYQIAFQNGGGLRAPILAGTVTMGDVLETLPFGNAIATFQLKGEYVIAALENGVRLAPAANGGFAQVAGLRYTFDPLRPAWHRIVDVEVWNGTAYEPLDPDAIYNVVTNDFMRKGGDNYLMFRDHAINPYDFGPALDEALADYFGAFSPVTPQIEGRIVKLPSVGIPVTPLGGGTLIYTTTQNLQHIVAAPAGAVTETINLVYTALTTVSSAPANFFFAGAAFELNAYRNNLPLPGFTFEVPVMVTLHYSDADIEGLDESTLTLYYWTGSAWEDAACGPYERHPEENWLSVPICHLTRFGLFARVEPSAVTLVALGAEAPTLWSIALLGVFTLSGGLWRRRRR